MSRERACLCVSSSNSSVTITPGIFPAWKNLADAGLSTYTFAIAGVRRPLRAMYFSSSSCLRESYPIWLMMNPAPFRIFFASLKYCGITSRSCRLWLFTTVPGKNRVGFRT